MTSRAPFEPTAWLAWGILAVFALLLVYGGSVSLAQDAGPAQSRPDAAAPPEDVRCSEDWCLVRRDTLRDLIASIAKFSQKAEELERLCGWRGR